MRTISGTLALVLTLSPAWAQLSPTATWTARLFGDYQVTPNITYLLANNYENKLDVYKPKNAAGPTPTVIYIHGGGWTGGTKEASILSILPYLDMGWAVVNVEYRLAKVSIAPAAVEDCRCALRWVIKNAKQYNFDITRLITTGNSAGGHLALTTGMLPDSAGLDRECYGTEDLKVAAIVNWYGITDVADELEGPNLKGYAVTWLGSLPNREEVARRVSPLQYVRKGLPPIITIHGDADPTVPYQHAVRLQKALNEAGVPNQLVTIPGGHHGNFTTEQNIHAFTEIFSFLKKNGLM
jgi:acetyl esterase/lipase